MNNLAIQRQIRPRPITEVAADLGLLPSEFTLWGDLRAKLDPITVRSRLPQRTGALVLVTTITPTKFGEGKTTTSIALAQGLCHVGVRAVVTLREPSIGPTLGIKGGGCGAGLAQVLPMEAINLHFTGDMHAITTAHNLLSSAIDNGLHFGNPLGLDVREVWWPRTVDLLERSLRQVTIGLGGPQMGVPRQDRFIITAASEVMAVFCLASDLQDLRGRLGRMVIGLRADRTAVRAEETGVIGAMVALLRDAFRPNLAQTSSGTPAIIHGGPFANIAHGTNSIVATDLALRCAEVVVTEAGFGADLGAEKFFDLVCPVGGFSPQVSVVVLTTKVLKAHGQVADADITKEDPEAIRRGLQTNAARHVANLRSFGVTAVVAINVFGTDHDSELQAIEGWCAAMGLPVARCLGVTQGAPGAAQLARTVLEAIGSRPMPMLTAAYPVEAPLEEKVRLLATKLYGATAIELSEEAHKHLRALKKMGVDHLPVCMAKTQYSFSDDASVLGAPSGFTTLVRELHLSAGAGYIVAVTGTMQLMPGLAREPAALELDVDGTGQIIGMR